MLTEGRCHLLLPSAALSLHRNSSFPLRATSKGSQTTSPSVCFMHRLRQTQFRRENRTLLELWAHFSVGVVLRDGIFSENAPAHSSTSPRPPHLVVRNSMSLLAFSSVSAAVSASSTSWVICGRFPLLPPRLMLEEVELELSPESGTGEHWSSRRKSKPPGREGQGGMQ